MCQAPVYVPVFVRELDRWFPAPGAGFGCAPTGKRPVRDALQVVPTKHQRVA